MTEYVYEYASHRTVAIYNDEEKTLLGSGFVISRMGHVLTCSHVVQGNESVLSVKLINGQEIKIDQVKHIHTIDVAILYPIKTKKDVPFFRLNTEYALLNRDVLVFGFPNKAYYTRGYYRTSRISSGIFIGTDKLQLPTLGLTERNIVIDGMSGGPVIDIATQEVIGVIFGYDKDLVKSLYDKDEALLALEEKRLDDLFIPVGTIVEKLPEIRELAMVNSNHKHVQLVSKVSEVLQLLGFGIRLVDLDDNQKHNVFSEISFGKILSFNILLLCIAEPEEALTPNKIQEIANNIPTYVNVLGVDKLEKVAIVTEGSITEGVKERAKQKGITIIQAADLFEKLIDFTDYLKSIRAQWLDDRNGISNKYLPLRAWNAVNHEFLPVENTEDYIRNWVRNSDKPGLLILGRYGSGKTTICRQLAYQMADAYLEEPGDNLIPILISLRRAKSLSLKQLIVQLIEDELNIVTSHRAFSKLNELGRLLMILDGFDEMSQTISRSQAFLNMRELSESFKGNSKFILTCRVEYFSESSDIEDIKKDREINRLGDFDVLILDDFDQNQIVSYLHNSLPNESSVSDVVGMLRNTANLIELAKRPVLLDMIIDTYPSLDKNKINISGLYETYTNRWLERDIKLGRTIFPKAAKLKLMQNIAKEMLKSGRLVINYDTLLQLLTIFFDNDYSKAAFHIHDILTNSFLVRNDRDQYYEFSHKSFYEYFIAKKIISDIQIALTQEITLDNSFASRRLTYEILQFMMEMGLSQNDLWKLIEKTKNKSLDEVGFIGGNAITLLKLFKADFSNRDYSNAVLGGALFNDTDLSNSKFISTNLFDGSFINAVLNNVDMTNADATRADFKSGKIIYSLDYSERQNAIVTDNSAQNKVSLWILDEHNNTLREKRSFTGHTDHVFCVAFSPSGKIIASGGQDQSIRVWDLENDTLFGVLRGHVGDIRSLEFFNEKELISCGFDGQIIQWDISRMVMTNQTHTDEEYWGMSLSREKNLIAVGNLNGAVEIWDYKSFDKWKQFTPDCDDKRRRAVQFFPPEDIVLTGCYDGSVYLWNYNVGEIRKVNVQHSPIVSLAVNRSRTLVASGGDDGTIAIWEGTALKHIKTFDAHTDYVNAMKFHPTKPLLYTAGPDGTVAVWNIEDYTLQSRFEEQFDDFRFSCEGLLITGIKGLPKSRIKHLKNLGAIERS